jgi:hypothetical protein
MWKGQKNIQVVTGAADGVGRAARGATNDVNYGVALHTDQDIPDRKDGPDQGSDGLDTLIAALFDLLAALSLSDYEK